MINWQNFIESENKEKEEEKNGIDTDHDSEKNEPKEHQKKVKEAKEKMLDFFTKRKEGAEKIAQQAKEKGGTSILTYWHFKAKAIPYTEVISAIKFDKPKEFFLNKCKNLLSKLNCEGMEQEDFQILMGKLEVWGEAMAQLFN